MLRQTMKKTGKKTPEKKPMSVRAVVKERSLKTCIPVMIRYHICFPLSNDFMSIFIFL